jgi:hypothetical protein
MNWNFTIIEIVKITLLRVDEGHMPQIFCYYATVLFIHMITESKNEIFKNTIMNCTVKTKVNFTTSSQSKDYLPHA